MSFADDPNCFCDDDEDEEEEEVSSSSSSRSTCGKPECCCCRYDPFEDDDDGCGGSVGSPETRDLPFALRKLAVMKCQMKKWRLERLELESQARSLRLALQSCGVEPNTILKPDPVLLHLRTDNARLQRRREELEDEVRDLRETLADRECCEDNPCDAVAYLKEKMLAVRHRCAVEKRHMRETIVKLQVRLQEAQEDSSCAALNRLRAKLRELTSQRVNTGNKIDRGASFALEKSIETMAELSNSCDELKRENERLLGEVEALKRDIKGDEKLISEADLESKSVEIIDLSKRVKACESMATQMRLQLAEKDNEMNELQKKLFAERQNLSKLEHELEQASLDKKTLDGQIEAMNKELSEKNDKITQLLREVRKSTEVALEASALEGEVERLRPAMTELEARRDELADELEKAKRELVEKNAEIEKLLSEREKSRADSQADVLERERRHSSEMESAREELSALRADGEKLKKIQADLERLELENQALKEERVGLIEARDKLNGATNRLNELEGQLEAAKSESTEKASLQKSRDELTERTKSLEEELLKARTDLEKARSEAVAEMRGELDGARRESAEQKSEGARLREEIERLRTTGDTANKQVEALSADKDRLERELGDLKWQLDKLKKERESVTGDELESLQAANAALKTELDQLKGKLNNLEAENKQLKSDGERLKVEAGKAKRASIEIGKKQSRASADSVRLAKELEACMAENEQLKRAASAGTAGLIPEELIKKEKIDGDPSKVAQEPTRRQSSGRQKSVTKNGGGLAAERDVHVKKESKDEIGDGVVDQETRTAVKVKAEAITDLAEASQALKNQMDKQIEAVDRMRELINYAEGKADERPNAGVDLLSSGSDGRDWSAAEINELFKTSRLLSEAIVRAEEEVRELEDVLKKMPSQGETTDAVGFDAESWLQSLTLSEMAELHDRICQLTSDLVQRDNGEDRCRASTTATATTKTTAELLNRRIAALQRRIADKQREAAARANEMHRALLVEQARLIRLSDDVNRGREINLAMRLGVEAGAIPLTITPMDECGAGEGGGDACYCCNSCDGRKDRARAC